MLHLEYFLFSELSSVTTGAEAARLSMDLARFELQLSQSGDGGEGEAWLAWLAASWETEEARQL